MSLDICKREARAKAGTKVKPKLCAKPAERLAMSER